MNPDKMSSNSQHVDIEHDSHPQDEILRGYNSQHVAKPVVVEHDSHPQHEVLKGYNSQHAHQAHPVVVEHDSHPQHEVIKEVGEKKNGIKSEAPLNDYVPVPAMEISEPSLSTDKRALLIGINYIGTEYELHGCVDDMLDVQDWLISEQGYIASNITLMSDDPSVTGAIMPTCANILAQMGMLVASAVAGSERFFAYSGHGGTAQVDANSVGSDAHGIAETICALDEDIINADIRATLVDPMPAGSSLFCLFDSCHSGTIVDLRYNCATVAKPSVHKPHYTHHDDANVSAFLLTDDKYPVTAAEVAVLSGCQNWQTSADITMDGKGQGALTGNFLKEWDKMKADGTPHTCYNVLLRVTNAISAEGYSQIPHLASGTFIDIHSALF